VEKEREKGALLLDYYLLRKTREEHTGNTIIRRYNGDGTIMWVQANERARETRPSKHVVEGTEQK